MKIILQLISYYFNLLAWINPKISGKQAFYLFAYPFKAKLKKSQQKFLNSAEQFKLNVENKNVQCYKWGKGKETILFVHGWQSHSYRWKPYINSFDKKKYTLYAFDAPGHGNSEGPFCSIPLYEKTMDALMSREGQMDHLIAHSIGSFACASYMYHHQYSPFSYISLASPFTANEFIADFRKRLQLTEKVHRHMSEYFIKYTGHPIQYYSHKTFNKAIKPKNTLIIHDKQDEATPYKNGIKLNQLMKKASMKVELLITDGFKHSLRNPSVLEKVIAFVNS